MKKITLLLMLFSFIMNAQYLTEDFESNTMPPAGWSVANTNANENWEVYPGLQGIAPGEGSYSAGVLYDVGQQNETLTSPSIDLSSATNPQLRFKISLSYFWAVDPNDNYDIIISVSNGGTTTAIWTETDLGTFTTAEWYDVTLDLTSYAGSSINLYFNYTGADGDYVLIDDINVEEAPACAVANNLEFTDYTSTTSTLSWANSGDFEIEYGEHPYTQGSGGTVVNATAANTYQLTSLNPATSYNVFIRQNCGGGLFSDFEEILVGTTPDVVTSYPYNNGFEASPNQALDINLGATNGTETSQFWSLDIDDLTDGDTSNDYANNGSAYFISGNTFIDADTNATIFFGPFTLDSSATYDVSVSQRNITSSSATTPNQDMELIYATTIDGSNNNQIASFDDMDNTAHQTRNGSFSPATSGDYYIGVRDKSTLLNGVTSGNAIIIDDIQVTQTLSISDIEGLKLNSYFDLINKEFNVSINDNTIDGIEIYNSLGQVVFSNKNNQSQFKIQMNSFAKGVYIAKMSINNNFKTIKFVNR